MNPTNTLHRGPLVIDSGASVLGSWSSSTTGERCRPSMTQPTTKPHSCYGHRPPEDST